MGESRNSEGRLIYLVKQDRYCSGIFFRKEYQDADIDLECFCNEEAAWVYGLQTGKTIQAM